MRILLITSAYPPMTGGPSRQAREIVESLTEHGHQVLALTTAPSRNDKNVRHIQLSRRGGAIGKVVRYGQMIKALTNTIRCFRPEVIHNQVFGGPLTLLSCVLGLLLNIPTLTKLTGERAIEAAGEKSWDRRGLKGRIAFALAQILDLALLFLSKYIWSTTPAFTQKLKRQYGLKPSKIFTYPNFTDLTRFQTVGNKRRCQHQTKRILTVCRLRPWKGLSDGFKALSILNDKSIKWRIIGDGDTDYRSELEREIGTLGVGDQVEIVQPVDPELIHLAYSEADVFLLPSRYEPFGIVLIEAMASGLPIIASDTGGIPYVLGEPPVGLLFSAGNSSDLASSIKYLYENPSHRMKFEAAGMIRAERFSISRGSRSIIREYKKIINA